MRKRTLALIGIGVITTAFGLSSCGSSDKGSSSSATADNTFVLGEFTILPPKNTMHAGAVTITADNRGGETHELVIVRAASADALPTKSDGSIDEEKITAQEVGEIEDIAAGTQRSKRFDLTEAATSRSATSSTA